MSLNILSIPGFHDNVGVGTFDGNALVQPLMINFDYIATSVTDFLRHAELEIGLIRYFDSK